MNKILLVAIPAILLFVSDGFAQNKLPQSEVDKFKIRNDSVFYDNKHIANYIHIEYEYYLGKKNNGNLFSAS